MSLHRLTFTDDLLIPLAEVKVQLREFGTDQDTLIESMIRGAVEECEGLLHRSILPATWVWRGAFCTSPIIIPQPAREITSVQCWDAAGAQQTLAETTEWTSDVEDDYRCFVFPASGQAWPSATLDRPNPVRIEFAGGWEDADAVPRVVKTWVLLRVGAFFMNRESWTHSQPIQRNEHIDRMLDRWVVPVV